MLESASPVAPPGRSQSGSLLEGKVAIPSHGGGGVSRRALIDRARASDSRVVGISAPAGYGKSTLLAEWAASEDRNVGWATVDRFDDDPASLLTLLATAGAVFSPEVASVTPSMKSVGTSLLGRSAPVLAQALSRTTEPFVLFVDDVHAASSPECEDILEVVLHGAPFGSQIVVASRYAQSYFARLRIDLPVLEISADDLRFERHEARKIFDQHHVRATDEDVDVAVARCEGWAAGLSLSALAAKAGAPVGAVSGEERLMNEYLHHECIRQLPRDMQEFLRRTAVLEQLSGDLCDEMLQRSDSWSMLRRIHASNLFLVSLDRNGRWFRYHALFREFLLSELRSHDGAIIGTLHERAATWLRREGMTDQAVDHLLAAGLIEPAGALVADIASETYQRGDVAIVERWLRGLGTSLIESSPSLAVLSTWAAVLQGKSPEAERRAGAIERMDIGDASDDDILAFDSARAMVRSAMCVDGPERALDDALFAVATEPEWSPWRDQALHLLGSARLLIGDEAGARSNFLLASACAAEAGNPDSILLSEAELALLAMKHSAWPEAEAHARAAIRAVDESHMEGYPTTTLALAASARLALIRGDAAEARRYLARAMVARVHCTHVLPYFAMRSRLNIARVFVGLGDRGAAMHIMHEIDELLARRPLVGVLAEEIADFRLHLDQSSAQTASVPLTPAEMRLLPYLQTHLTIAEIGKRLFISRNTVSSEVGSIYRKLDVTTRGDAVERAREMGLLGG